MGVKRNLIVTVERPLSEWSQPFLIALLSSVIGQNTPQFLYFSTCLCEIQHFEPVTSIDKIQFLTLFNICQRLKKIHHLWLFIWWHNSSLFPQMGFSHNTIFWLICSTDLMAKNVWAIMIAATGRVSKQSTCSPNKEKFTTVSTCLDLSFSHKRNEEIQNESDIVFTGQWMAWCPEDDCVACYLDRLFMAP